MRIAFATTQTVTGSTVAGRIMPLAEQLSKKHEIHALVLESPQAPPVIDGISYHFVGREPFTRSESGKKRYKGWRLLAAMGNTAIKTCSVLTRIKPDVVVIVKSLPSNVAGVYLWRLISGRRSLIVLDVDDFELTANQLSSLVQRAAVHGAERIAAGISGKIIAATPFLADHFTQLTQQSDNIRLIPTGLTLTSELEECAKESPTQPTIAYLGTVSVGSGHRVDMLPEMLDRLREAMPGIKLKIIGAGDDVTSLREEFARRHVDDAVSWHGRFTLAELPSLIKDVSLFVDPIDSSITQRAKSSFRVALAAALGRPVVTSDVGIRPALLPASIHSRLFAKPSDPADYANKCQQLLSNPFTDQERQAMRSAASRFTWERLADDYSCSITV